MSRLERFYELLRYPLTGRSRIALALLIIPLGLTFLFPLWTIRMAAPQYPAGLELRIFAHTVDGDVQEVNTLNHYIGMARIDRAALSDLDWIPFALGFLAIFALRVAAIGNVRHSIDLLVLFLYFSVFSMGRFAYKLWVFGHDLDPTAPFRMDPFMPAVLGTKQVANFSITALPGGASLLIGLFGLGALAVVAWNLRLGMRHELEPRPPC